MDFQLIPDSIVYIQKYNTCSREVVVPTMYLLIQVYLISSHLIVR
jgi:hypothetical protein